jgi:hypothetical protein
LKHITWQSFCTSLAQNKSITDLTLNTSVYKVANVARLTDATLPFAKLIRRTGGEHFISKSTEIFNLLSSELLLNQLFNALRDLSGNLSHLRLVVPYDSNLSNLCIPLCSYLSSQTKDKSHLKELSIVLNSASNTDVFSGLVSDIVLHAMSATSINSVRMVILSILHTLSKGESNTENTTTLCIAPSEDKRTKTLSPTAEVSWQIPSITTEEKSVQKLNILGIIPEDLILELANYVQDKSSLGIESLSLQTNYAVPKSKKHLSALSQMLNAANGAAWDLSRANNPLGDEELYEHFWNTLCSLLKKISIDKLALHGQNLDDKALLHVTNALKQNANIKILEFGYTNLSVAGVLAAVLFLARGGTSKNLKSLDLVELSKDTGTIKAGLMESGQAGLFNFLHNMNRAQIPAVSNIPILSELYDEESDNEDNVADEDEQEKPKKTKKTRSTRGGRGGMRGGARGRGGFPMTPFGHPTTVDIDEMVEEKKINWGQINFEEAEEFRQFLIQSNKNIQEECSAKTTIDPIMETITAKLRAGEFDLQTISQIASKSFEL